MGIMGLCIDLLIGDDPLKGYISAILAFWPVWSVRTLYLR